MFFGTPLLTFLGRHATIARSVPSGIAEIYIIIGVPSAGVH